MVVTLQSDNQTTYLLVQACGYTLLHTVHY